MERRSSIRDIFFNRLKKKHSTNEYVMNYDTYEHSRQEENIDTTCLRN
jgi:hypothetical protein